MIVYVESNFLLEIARQQEEAPAAQRILSFAETQKITLVVPSISIFEPFSTLTYYGLERLKFVEEMKKPLNELSRSAPYKGLARDLEPLSKTLLSLKHSEMNALETVTARLLLIATLINLTGDIFANARAIEATFDLSPQDAIVFASIEAHLAQQPQQIYKCFASRNARDYGDPALIDRLKPLNCRYIRTFHDALDLIENVMRNSGSQQKEG